MFLRAIDFNTSGSKIGIVFIIGICLLFTASCKNPFSTREPEPPPPSTDQSLWVQPVSYGQVLENFKDAIWERNIDNYKKCFGSDGQERSQFIFVPELSIANNDPDKFVNWNTTDEVNYINHIFNQTPADSVSRLDLWDVAEFEDSDSVRVTKDYELLFAHTDHPKPRLTSGRMVLTIKKGLNSLWYITYWADYKTSDVPVWSVLKAEF
jgi:hypothetical protein